MKKFNIHLMFNFVCLRLICLDIFSQNFQLILDGNFNDFKKNSMINKLVGPSLTQVKWLGITIIAMIV